MTKAELVSRLMLTQANRYLTEREVRFVVETFFKGVADAMSRGDRVELRGFGSFWAKPRGARKGRNPRTGDPVNLPDKHLPSFRPSIVLGDRLGPVE